MSLGNVLQGKYKGYYIGSVKDYACIFKDPKNREVYITSYTAKGANVIDKDKVNSLSSAVGGALLLGSGGAALGTNKSKIIMEIEWVDGEKSLISIDNKLHEKIIVGMFENLTKEQHEEITQEDAKTISKNINTQIGCTIALLLFIIGIYFFY